MTSGARNLVLLGVISVVVASVTTGIALAIYHNSGDIYLDRSRPGFLPDEEEISEDERETEEKSFDFSEKGEITGDVLKEYLEKLDEEINSIEKAKDAFSDDALSDSRLGI